MSAEELTAEIAAGIAFRGFAAEGALIGVMGAREVQGVTLIRHAYVGTVHRRRRIGGRLLQDLSVGTGRLIVIHTSVVLAQRAGLEGR